MSETEEILRDHPEILERIKRYEKEGSKGIPLEEVIKQLKIQDCDYKNFDSWDWEMAIDGAYGMFDGMAEKALEAYRNGELTEL